MIQKCTGTRSFSISNWHLWEHEEIYSVLPQLNYHLATTATQPPKIFILSDTTGIPDTVTVIFCCHL